MESSHHLTAVRTELEVLVARDPGGRPDVRALARLTRVLPVYYDWTVVGGIRASDREICWVDYEPPYPAQRIDEERMRNMMLFRAGLEYSALRALAPARPGDTQECPHRRMRLCLAAPRREEQPPQQGHAVDFLACRSS